MMARRLVPIFCAFLACCHATASDWPQWLGPNRSGVVAVAEPIQPWPASGPKIVWRVPCGEGCATPVVSGERVVVMDRVADTERIRCLAAGDGAEQWKVTYEETARVAAPWGGGARCTPAIANGRVFALGIGGRLTCASMADGQVVWHKRIVRFESIGHRSYGVYGSPLVVGDVVVCTRQRSPAVVAYDCKTGELTWKALRTGTYFHTPQLATVAGRRQIVVGVWKDLVGLDASSGAVLWRHAHPKPIDALTTPLVHGDVVAFNGYGIPTYAVKVTAGEDGFATKEVWQSRDVRPWFNAAIAHKGRLYCPSQMPGRRGGLVCCNISTGKLLWRFPIKGIHSKATAWVQMLGERLLISRESGELILGEDGGEAFKQLARAKVLDGEAFAMPAFADGRLYWRSFREVICLGLRRPKGGDR